jgi:Protein of unknown function (DUF2892)
MFRAKELNAMQAHDQKNKIQIFKNKLMRERIIRAVAGSMVLISIILAYFISLNWLGLAAFVGINLLQSAFTKFCPLELILDKAGVRNSVH